MAFLDNSKDIIIDAVLTDLGRQRLAQGRFNIARFALGDDEINYGLYDPNNSNGSSYYDLDILRTPVFEAFTNNISTMNSRLVTYSANDLLYLPVLKLNNKGLTKDSKIEGGSTIKGGFQTYSSGDFGTVFLVSVNSTTKSNLGTGVNYIDGTDFHKNYIRIDQGMDNNNVDVSNTIDFSSKFSELLEEQYTLEIDNRFGNIIFEGVTLKPTFVDDDDIALYSFNIFDNNTYISKLLKFDLTTNKETDSHVLAGARGTVLRFGVTATEDMKSDNTNLFDLYGVAVTIGSKSYSVIHTTVTVTGLKTGYSIDVPVSFIKSL